MSYGAFIKDGWVKIGNLRWWTKILRPIKIIKQKLKKVTYDDAELTGDPLIIDNILKHLSFSESQFRLENSKDFLEWRYNNNTIKRYRYFEYGDVAFIYKLSLEHGFRELIVGETYFTTHFAKRFSRALRALCKKIIEPANIDAISFALLSPPLVVIRGLLQNGFIPHKLTAPFIVKPISAIVPTNPKAWNISIGDIDTW